VSTDNVQVKPSEYLPLKGQNPRSLHLKQRIVEMRAAGATQDAIAATCGISRQRVTQILAEPEAEYNLAQFVRENQEQLRQIGGKVVDSIEEDVESDQWMARSAARQQFINILGLAHKTGVNGEKVDGETQRQVRTLRHTVRSFAADGTSVEEIWEYVAERTKEVIGEDVSGLRDEVLRGLLEA
jgi:hypothetical protein